jgi:hypothetical protein
MIESLQRGTKIELLGAMLADKSMPGMPDPKTLFGEGNPPRLPIAPEGKLQSLQLIQSQGQRDLS